MTDPLIDREALAHHITSTRLMSSWESADAVLAYLRSVLTPEALRPVEKYAYGAYSIPDAASGEDIHRRIFGEDK